jgi:hypothetical protein
MKPFEEPGRADRAALIPVLMSIVASVVASSALQRTDSDAWGYIKRVGGGSITTPSLIGLLAYPLGMAIAAIVSYRLKAASGTTAVRGVTRWLVFLVAGMIICPLMSLIGVTEGSGAPRTLMIVGFVGGVILVYLSAGAITVSAAVWLFERCGKNPWPYAFTRGVSIFVGSAIAISLTRRRFMYWLFGRWLKRANGLSLRLIINAPLLCCSIVAVAVSALALRRANALHNAQSLHNAQALHNAQSLHNAQALHIAPVSAAPGSGEYTWSEPGDVAPGDIATSGSNEKNAPIGVAKFHRYLLIAALIAASIATEGVFGPMFSLVLRSSNESVSEVQTKFDDMALLSVLVSIAVIGLISLSRNRRLHAGWVLAVVIVAHLVTSEFVQRASSINWRLGGALLGVLAAVLGPAMFVLVAKHLPSQLHAVGLIAMVVPLRIYAVLSVFLRLPSLDQAPLVLGLCALALLIAAARFRPVPPSQELLTV